LRAGANRGIEPKKLTGLLRSELDWVVMKALEKDRARRYETATGLAADVQRHLTGEPVVAHPPSTSYQLRKFLRKHRGPVLAAALVALALGPGRSARFSAWWRPDGSGTRRRRRGPTRADETRQRHAAEEQRNRATDAEQAGQRAAAINQFLLTDVFARKEPDIIGPLVTGLETLEDLLDRAAAIPQAFPDDPAAVAELRQAVGDTYHNVNQADGEE
jgi:eukaryotic-like serine/threonine-protein kinase